MTTGNTTKLATCLEPLVDSTSLGTSAQDEIDRAIRYVRFGTRIPADTFANTVTAERGFGGLDYFGNTQFSGDSTLISIGLKMEAAVTASNSTYARWIVSKRTPDGGTRTNVAYFNTRPTANTGLGDLAAWAKNEINLRASYTTPDLTIPKGYSMSLEIEKVSTGVALPAHSITLTLRRE